jgi:hypothetical protein
VTAYTIIAIHAADSDMVAAANVPLMIQYRYSVAVQ